jgi:MYXO-CTERM domain-containing protein
MTIGAAALAAAVLLPAAPSRADTSWLLNSWEGSLENWGPESGTTVGLSTDGATHGTNSMNINNSVGAYWSATVEYQSNSADPRYRPDVIAAFNWAGDGREAQSWFEFDVTWLNTDNPNDWRGMRFSINSANGWVESPDNLAQRTFNGGVYDLSETFHVVTPKINTFAPLGDELPNGDGQWYQIHFAANGSPQNMKIDNFRLITPDAAPIPEPTGLAVLAMGAAAVLRRRRVD